MVRLIACKHNFPSVGWIKMYSVVYSQAKPRIRIRQLAMEDVSVAENGVGLYKNSRDEIYKKF